MIALCLYCPYSLLLVPQKKYNPKPKFMFLPSISLNYPHAKASIEKIIIAEIIIFDKKTIHSLNFCSFFNDFNKSKT